MGEKKLRWRTVWKQTLVGLVAALVTTCLLLVTSWHGGYVGQGTKVELEEVTLRLPGAFKAHHYLDNTDLLLRRETRPYLPFIYREPLFVNVGFSFRHTLREQSGPTRYCLYREPPYTCVLVFGKKKTLALRISGHEADVQGLVEELERQLLGQHVVRTEKAELKALVDRAPTDPLDGQPPHGLPEP